MPSIINASTSTGLVQTADTSGVLQLQSNGTTIATISSTGLSTQVGSPAFSATRTATTQSINSGVFTKVQFSEEVFDTNNNFDSTTNYRFTPTVAGYYQVNWSLLCDLLTSTTEYIVALYKNGSNYSWASNLTAASAHYNATTGSELVYLNGSTDYIEVYAHQNSGLTKLIFVGGATFPSRFSASMVRSA